MGSDFWTKVDIPATCLAVPEVHLYDGRPVVSARLAQQEQIERLLEEALAALHPLERVSALAVTAVERVREARRLLARL